jgi:hypothetical protein
MGKLFFISILLLGCLSGCQRGNQIYLSNWKTSAPVIDGQLSEWQLPLEQPSSQVSIRYRCSNDAEYLYLAVQANEEYVKALMLHQGAKIWIDTTAKRKDKFGLGYPIPIKESEIELLASEAKGDERKFMQLYAEAMQDFDLIGVADEALRISNLTSKDMKVAMNFDDLKVMSFEIRIPFKRIFGRTPNFDETISIGIQINNPSKTMEEEGNDGSLFNDRNQSTLTQSNPMLGPSPNQQQYNGPTRQASMPNIWVKVKLSAQ